MTHQFTWHATGRSLLAAQLAAIETARSSVRLEVFKFVESEIGERYRAALVAAARRGVKVFVIVDAVGSFGLRRDYFAELGAGMRWSNELRLSSFSIRDHRKLLVVDETVAFVGGCNIATEYWGDGVTRGWLDVGVEAAGPVAGELAAEFDRQWQRAAGERVRSRRRIDCGDVEVLLSGPGFGRNALREALRRELAGARAVAIMSAYFLPSRRLRRLLAMSGRVRLLLAGRSDVPAMQLATRSLYRRLLRKRIEIWEYRPQVLHAKLIVADDVVYVGSSNLDPRSLRINFEVMLRIQDAGLAATARRQFEAALAEHAEPVTLATWRASRSWWERLKQRAAYWFFARLDPELPVGRGL